MFLERKTVRGALWGIGGGEGGGGREKENKALTQSQDKTLSVDSPFPLSPFSNENSSADH